MKVDPSGRMTGAEWLPSPNCSPRQKDCVVDLLVLHSMSLPHGECNNTHITDLFLNRIDVHAHPTFNSLIDVQVSSHFVIFRDGKVTQFVSVYDEAWHAGESSWEHRTHLNRSSIGIELEGTDDSPFEESQCVVLYQLSKAIMARFDAISMQRIVGHSDIAPSRKTDPGKGFDWSLFYKSLAPTRVGS